MIKNKDVEMLNTVLSFVHCDPFSDDDVPIEDPSSTENL